MINAVQAFTGVPLKIGGNGEAGKGGNGETEIGRI